ncbi:flippase [Bacillus sp. JJ1521]|uniref:flippase n=1 Tax=Bacillus sp. JJ1521 TaxID=3122957 RepID=UPI0030000E7F
MPTQGNSFIKNSTITLVRQFLGIIFGLLLLVLLARFLGDKAYGEYTLITLLPQMLLTFLNLGINSATIYYVSRKEVDINTAFNTNVFTALLLSLIGMIIGVITILLLGDSKFSEIDPAYLYLILAGLPFMFLMTFLQTVFQGLENFKMFNTILVIQQFSNLLFVAVLIVVFDFHLFGSLLAFMIGFAITVVVIFIVFITKYNVTIHIKYFSVPFLKKTIGYGLKAHVSNMMTFLNYRLDLLLVGYFLNLSSVGIYSAALNVGERISIFSQAISSVLLPRVASLDTTEGRNKITTIVTRNLTLFIILLSLVLFFLSDFVFQLLFGPKYSSSSIILKLLLPGLAVLSIEKVLSNDLAGRGKPELNMYVSFVNVILNVILNLILIPPYGIEGAAIASTITYIISFIMKVFIFKKESGESISSILIIKKHDVELYRTIFKKLRVKV